MKLTSEAVERVVDGDQEARRIVAVHLGGDDALLIRLIDEALAAALRRGLRVASALHDVEVPRPRKTQGQSGRLHARGSLEDLLQFVRGGGPDNRLTHAGSAPQLPRVTLSDPRGITRGTRAKSPEGVE